MRLNQLIDKINSLANSNDFKIARTYIEINLEELASNGNYLKLNYEASQLYRIIRAEKTNGFDLSRFELHTINEINKASNNYDIAVLRMLLKTDISILHKREVRLLLSPTAKSVLTAMGYDVTTPPLPEGSPEMTVLQLLQDEKDNKDSKHKDNKHKDNNQNKAPTFYGSNNLRG